MTGVPTIRIAVDIGGTFTDIVLMSGNGVLQESKVSTTPADPSAAVVEGVRALLDELAIPPGDVAEVLHGTTVGSNTLLQRSGAATGLITTRGFRDVLEIGRIRMPEMFDLTWSKPKPLVPRRHRLEIAERIAADGSIVEPLQEKRRRRRNATPGRCGDRVDRHLLHQQLSQSRARAARRGIDTRAASAPARVGILCRAAGDEGVRADQHHGRERVSARGHAALPDTAHGRSARHRHRRACAGHDLQRRNDLGRERARKARAGGGVRPSRRGDRRCAPRRGAHRERYDHLRHGRHHRQGHHHRGWAPEHDVRIRIPRRHQHVEPLHQGRRLHAEGAGDRYRRGRGRRRLAREHRPRRPAARRAGIRGRRSRPRLLRPRQRAPHRHRRQRRPRLRQRAIARRRTIADRPAKIPRRHRGACRTAARHRRRGRGARHPRGRQCRDGTRRARRHGRARPRSARFDLDRDGRQRRHPCHRPGATARHRSRGRAAAIRRVFRSRHARRRCRARPSQDRARAA